jgi:hypothetical protein
MIIKNLIKGIAKSQPVEVDRGAVTPGQWLEHVPWTILKFQPKLFRALVLLIIA